jgi:hypothetical protein
MPNQWNPLTWKWGSRSAMELNPVEHAAFSCGMVLFMGTVYAYEAGRRAYGKLPQNPLRIKNNWRANLNSVQEIKFPLVRQRFNELSATLQTRYGEDEMRAAAAEYGISNINYGMNVQYGDVGIQSLPENRADKIINRLFGESKVVCIFGYHEGDIPTSLNCVFVPLCKGSDIDYYAVVKPEDFKAVVSMRNFAIPSLC